MERALALSRLQGPLPEGYQRLYFGAEFCPWAMPGEGPVLAALEAAREAGWGFTLVTPVCYEPTLATLQALLRVVLPRFGPADEVVVNDWGGLAVVRETAEVPVVLGRALSGQKRGPRILDLELTPAQRDYFQGGSWYGREAVRLLGEEGIGRVELDNLLQGAAPLPAPLHGSLHSPFVMVTSSRNCPFRADSASIHCAGCDGEAFTLTTPQTRVPLLQAGNTQFLRNDRLPKGLGALGIDRLVEHPHLPR